MNSAFQSTVYLLIDFIGDCVCIFIIEVMDTCPLVSQITLAHPWNSPTSGTPDLFNSSCAPQNLQARTGVGSCGIYLLNTFTDNREYIQAPLNTPLIAGQNYCVSFW